MPENIQPDCIEPRCRCHRTCIIQDRCLFTHPLAEGHHGALRTLLPYGEDIKEDVRTGRVVAFFEKRQPAPVRPRTKKKKKNKRYNEPTLTRQQAKELVTINQVDDIQDLKAFFKKIVAEPEPNFHEEKFKEFD